MLQTLIDQKTVKPGNWSSLTVFLWFQLSKMGLYRHMMNRVNGRTCKVYEKENQKDDIDPAGDRHICRITAGTLLPEPGV